MYLFLSLKGWQSSILWIVLCRFHSLYHCCHSLSLIVIYFHSLSLVIISLCFCKVTFLKAKVLKKGHFSYNTLLSSVAVSLVVSLVVTLCHSLYHSLSLVVTCCHSFSLIVICCHSLYHSLSLIVPLVVTGCHSLSFVVTRCTTRLSFYKWLVEYRKW